MVQGPYPFRVEILNSARARNPNLGPDKWPKAATYLPFLTSFTLILTLKRESGAGEAAEGGVPVGLASVEKSRRHF